MSLLRVRDLRLSFGGLHALAGVSLDLGEGETLALIGPNGSGKTSLFNCITRLYRATSGALEFAGKSLLGVFPHAVVGLGIARTFQNLRLFPSLSVLDNLMLGRHRHFKRSFLDAVLRRREEERRQRRRCEEIVEFLGLQACRKHRASDCPYGVQKRVELGRALATEPRLLLLDEPLSGLTAEEKGEVSRCVREIGGRLGIAILLVEHDLRVASRLAGRMIALDRGVMIAEGTPSDVRRSPEVVRAYLGEG
jgi:branched-chain amino acid transport system ATP-binding protein